MLSRSSAIIVSLTSLFAGIVLGIILGRGGPVVSAQVAGAGRGEPAAAADRVSARSAATEAPTTQSMTCLAKQYEQFQQVNRTFELVAKAVSPSVVHIVARRRLAPKKAAEPAISRKRARASSSAATSPLGFSS